jgi:hypothetical protein
MARRPRLPELAAALAATLALSACGGSGGSDVLSASTKKLDDVRSGVLALRLVIQPHGGAGTHPFGFALEGPFALGDGTPRAKMTYTQIANGRTGTATVVLDGSGGHVDSNGQRHDLTGSELTSFRSATRSVATGGGLRLADWATSATQRSCGADAVCVEGDLDPGKALAGLTQLQRQLGAQAPDAADTTLEQAVRSSRYTLVAGKQDDQLRRLRMTVDFRMDVPERLRKQLGSFVGATIDFVFRLQRPNADVGLR